VEQEILHQLVQLKVVLVVIDQEVDQMVVLEVVEVLWLLELMLVQELLLPEELEVDFQMLWVLQDKVVVHTIILAAVEPEVETLLDLPLMVED
jgi:hypothetical protein|tara:strand:+ start:346 stop:624 length:279 start_codon:yes stop_codon:yes gene_type:complete